MSSIKTLQIIPDENGANAMVKVLDGFHNNHRDAIDDIKEDGYYVFLEVHNITGKSNTENKDHGHA